MILEFRIRLKGSLIFTKFKKYLQKLAVSPYDLSHLIESLDSQSKAVFKNQLKLILT